jgi:cytochrome o ubiquinol oxidase subunit 2
MKFYKLKKIFVIFFLTLLLSGCHGGLFSPGGDVAINQRNLIIISFLIMLTIVIPVIFMTIFFSYKYYHGFKNHDYNPNWNHSYKIEALTWGIPILIILFLGILSWKKTHDLDPPKSLKSINQSIKINVISLNWKWLFIYPKEKIIIVNEVFFPKNFPVNFFITSNTVMNSFFIPSLGSQIYSMPGMTTRLNLIANFPGFYKGISANYSGKGFSDMKFNAISSYNKNFYYSWINKVKRIGKKISDIKDINNFFQKNRSKYFYFFDNKLIEKFLSNN